MYIKIKKIMKKNILGVLLITSSIYNAQTIPSSTENYIYVKTCLGADCINKAELITYFDGLARPKQILDVKASPLVNDIVTKIEYDEFGRQVKDYLPVPQQGSSYGAIYGNPLSNVTSPYGTEKIYSEKILENSPLDRIQQQIQVGNDWSNKPVNFAYGTNIATEVKKFVTTTTWTNNATSSSLTQSGNYGASQLYKNIVTDEDGNVSIEFKNGEGQILLVRKNDGIKDSDTYYVYNEFNQLAYVISPEAAAKASLSQTDLDDLCYQYRYDGRNRLVEKKIPGKGWEYLVYDNQDRLVMTQDANLGSDQQWVFTKYDKFGRVAYTGIYASVQTYGGAGRDNEQSALNGKGSNNVERTSSSGFTTPGLIVYYDNLVVNNYPNTFTKVLSVNYYDAYPTGTPPIPAAILAQDVLPQTGSLSTKGLLTASYINNVETNGWTKNYFWYDSKGRTIGTHSTNHMNGYTKTEKLLDFVGVPQKSNIYHKRRSTDTELVIQEEFVYDHQNRLLKHYHEVVGITPKELLTDNHYNEIGQLDQKKVGGTGSNPIQTVDYAYNIRGWLKGINSGDIPTSAPYVLNNGKLFGYRIKYNNPENPTIASAKYNGNIAEVDWIEKDNSLKRYGYQYDKLNRLLAGLYQDPDNTVPESHINDEVLTYDLNGNIKTLVRNGKHGKYYTPIVVDNLSYQYTGNRVTNIIDASGNSSGYEGGGQTMTYDANGNTTAMPDKGIAAIAYNFLNLPKQINQNANVTNYYYRADGVKIKKKFVLTNASGTKTINTEYLDGFQYSTPNTDPLRKALEEPDEMTVSATTAGEEEAFAAMENRQVAMVVDPGNPEVENMVLSFFPTAEGYYDYENLRYIYQYKDHLGNVRVSYVRKPDNTIAIMDRNDYYPFGMNFLKNNMLPVLYDPMSIPYNYKYNGKELQETGMYAMDFRHYMSDIGRFIVQDGLSEIMPSWTPYRFAFNNPTYFSDPTGLFEEGGNALAHCPTCPKTDEFKPYIDDKENVYVYNSETNTASLKVTPIEEVVVGGGSKSNSNNFSWLWYSGYNVAKDSHIRLNYYYPNNRLIYNNYTSPAEYAFYRYHLQQSTRAQLSTQGQAMSQILKTKEAQLATAKYYASKGIKPSGRIRGGAGTAQILRGAGTAVVVVSAGMSVYNVATADNKAQALSGEIGGWAGAWAGAEYGAMIGSFAGPWGTVIGGVVGGAVGYYYGSETGTELYNTLSE